VPDYYSLMKDPMLRLIWGSLAAFLVLLVVMWFAVPSFYDSVPSPNAHLNR
jgi:hypothetical protein